MLLLINGPPGVGKSTIARRYGDEHPRAIVVEIDEVRTQLREWSTDESTRQAARDLAVDLVEGHLRRGHDVVVPQYLGRPEFRDRLHDLAAAAGVRFVEVVLAAPVAITIERFRDRRSDLAGADHPETDVADDAVAATVEDAVRRLAGGAEAAGRVVVDASGDPDATYGELVRALAEAGPAS